MQSDAPRSQLGVHPLYEEKSILKGHSKAVMSVALSPDGQYLATGSEDTTIRILNPKSGALVNTLTGHSKTVYSIAISPDGHRLASASKDNTICLWDLSSATLVAVLKGHSNDVEAIKFSPDGALLASAASDGTARLWNMTSDTQAAILSNDNRIGMFSVAFSPDGGILAVGSFEKIHFWDVASQSHLTLLQERMQTVWSVAFSPDGTLLASGSHDRTVRLWHTTSRTLLAVLQGHANYVRSVAFSPDGMSLASGSQDNTVRFWDVASRSHTTTRSFGDGVTFVTFSHDGTYLMAGIRDGTVRLLQRNERTPIGSPPTSPIGFSTGNVLSDTIANTLQDTQHMITATTPLLEDSASTSAGNDITNVVTLLNSGRIGSGGFGELFLGTHQTLGKVAMKRPHVLLKGASLRRFLREVDLWCRMSHRYILPCLGTCRIGQEIYMVSPFAENGDLISCIQRGVVMDRSKLLYEVAEALAHLHHRGIVHGDIKAQNILLSDEGSALLCDFGLAKAFDTMETSTDAKGAGSIRWMAPELFDGGSRSMATDVYSFGITIAEVLSGRPPFDHLMEAAAVMRYIILKDGKPRKEPSKSPEGRSYSVLWETAEKCWVTEPGDRPYMAQVSGMLFPLTREKPL